MATVSNNTALKRCSKCKQLLPLSRFFKCKSSRDGFYSSCKDCKKQYTSTPEYKEWRTQYQRNYQREYAFKQRRSKGMSLTRKARFENGNKECTKCYDMFPATLGYFHKAAANPQGLSSWCKKCSLKYNEIKRREKGIREEKQLQQRDGKQLCYGCNSWKLLTTDFFQRRKNKRTGFSSRCKECENENKRRNIQSIRLSSAAATARRRAKQLCLPNTFTQSEWERCLNYWNYCCCICGKPVGLWHTMAADHWIPISSDDPRNPGTVAMNILPLCHSKKGGTDCCNKTKWKHEPVKWLENRLGKRKAKRKLKEIQSYFKWVTEPK